MRHRVLAAAVVAMVTAASPVIPAEPVVITGPAKAIDGDTIKIGDQRIRIHGVDAPEAGQTCDLAGRTVPCGRQAAEALARKMIVSLEVV